MGVSHGKSDLIMISLIPVTPTQVFDYYQRLLNSENYVTRRQSLKVRHGVLVFITVSPLSLISSHSPSLLHLTSSHLTPSLAPHTSSPISSSPSYPSSSQPPALHPPPSSLPPLFPPTAIGRAAVGPAQLYHHDSLHQ